MRPCQRPGEVASLTGCNGGFSRLAGSEAGLGDCHSQNCTLTPPLITRPSTGVQDVAYWHDNNHNP